MSRAWSRHHGCGGGQGRGDPRFCQARTLEEFEEYRRPSKERKTMDAEVDVSERVSYAHRISYTRLSSRSAPSGAATQPYHYSDMDLGVLKAPETAPPPAPFLPSPTVKKSPPKEAAAGKLTPSPLRLHFPDCLPDGSPEIRFHCRKWHRQHQFQQRALQE
ncbi:uncharacterized protein LOC112350191 [Selaginella moellendorffii]|uniref:uncharacterized protein LOC112350191 n=1 Tax=Selaginella moellendorffii TaxID=88036 RepID=UPI000D1CE033|nr:uncharacterized protein LOC112350191 [Selaginella moellendorffii]|eukprot:XP_024541740.1 uncharacterized protein LOC112350191 [Selaginella moellendorffii]